MSQSRTQSPAPSTYSLQSAIDNIHPPPPSPVMPTAPKKKGFRAYFKGFVAKLRMKSNNKD